ncbi:hypothetical protein [Shewanella metallivivens]|uniref:Phage holin family protein n=1 Tax=Shewanella metallivivens TaxID=2872342 RepID=A0ABT5TMY7_9GAMM|nr:hypothetical protein [Shewanella metallivivens]MDD8059234.1 hypothetical protein [Shewanella metallivivens]
MRKNLTKSIIIGSILGLTIGLSQIDSSAIGIFVSIFTCIILGLVTVIVIDERPHLYTIPAILASGIFLFSFYGIEHGAIYTAGVAGVYGIFSVQLFKASFIAIDNLKFLIEKLLKKK